MRARTVVLLVAALVGSMAVPARAEVAAVPDVLTIHGDVRDADRDTVEIQGTPEVYAHPEIDHVEARAGGGTLSVTAPGGTRFEAGRTYATRFTPTTTLPGLRAQECPGYAAAGTMTVHELSRQADGRLTSLALDYSTTCDAGVRRTASGSLRWNATTPWTASRSTDLALAAALEPATSTGDVVVTNTGTTTQVHGRSTVGRYADEPASWLTVVDDGCAGASVPPGGSCTVRVRGRVEAPSQRARVRTPDGSGRGYVVGLVELRGMRATTTVGVWPEHGRVTVAVTSGGTSASWERSVDGGPWQALPGTQTSYTDEDVRPDRRYSYRAVPRLGDQVGVRGAPVTTAPLPQATGNEGRYVPLQPSRLLDTRTRPGRVPVGAGQTVTVPVSGRAGVVAGAGVRAVVLNVTATEATAATYAVVWPTGQPLPPTSNVNVGPGQTRPTQVIVPVGPDGAVQIRNSSGTVHLLVDVQGYFSTTVGPDGSDFHPQDPRRLHDTRQTSALAPGERRWFSISDFYRGTAVSVNLTAVSPTAGGFLSATPAPTAATTSEVNFVAGGTTANHAFLRVGAGSGGDQGFWIYNGSPGRTHVLVDVDGVFATPSVSFPGLRYGPVPAVRLSDSRYATPLGRGEVRAVAPVQGRGVFQPPAVLQVLNVTVTQPAEQVYLGVLPTSTTYVSTSVVNAERGQTVPNLAVTGVAGGDDTAYVFTSNGPTHVVVDMVGRFY